MAIKSDQSSTGLDEQARQKDIGAAKVIAVMGMTGSGKSTFIHTLTGAEDIVVGNGLHSCTQKPRLVEMEYDGKTLVLIDTPGFDDTFRTDADVLQDVAEVLNLTYSQNAKLSGIIYLHRIIDPRMTHGGMRNLAMFRKLCGTNPMQNVILATTFWDQVDPAQAQLRLNELQTTPEFWKDMLDDGAQVGRFDNNQVSALSLVSQLMHRGRVDLQIQVEMSEHGKPLDQTQAGIALHDELLELTQKHSEEMQKLKDLMEQARREQDFKLATVLQKAAKKSQRDIDVLTAQQQRLAEDRRNEIRALEQHFQHQLRRMELQKERKTDARLSAETEKIKADNRPAPQTTPAKPATSTKRSKKVKYLKVAGVGISAAASIAGCVLNPLMVPSAISALVLLANSVFGDNTDTGDAEGADDAGQDVEG